jgi:hypothetical protein
MSNAKGNPGSQPFNVGARYNLTKSRANTWWGHAPYHNNRVQKDAK